MSCCQRAVKTPRFCMLVIFFTGRAAFVRYWLILLVLKGSILSCIISVFLGKHP